MSSQITITLPDGSTQDVARGTTAGEIAANIGSRLAKAAVAAKLDDEWIDLDRPIERDGRVEIVVAASDGGREVIRHSTAHVMAEAVIGLFPGAKYSIGPAIADGFYYDFDLPDGQTFTEDDLGKIEDEMRRIVKADQTFVREEVAYDDALATFADQPYKREIIEKVRGGDASEEDAGEVGGAGGVSLYRNIVDGEVAFTDLCRGPHVPSTGRIGAFKLTKVAGAYWRGNEKGPMLQRIYGTAWESQKALDEYLHRVEEAERRDHRKLGAELDLFSFPDEIGSGLPVFHP
jgi:threonyl-tRNA synthetase